jgi:transposase
MSIKVKETLETEEIKAVADTGDQYSLEVERCLENGITPYVPERIQNKGDFSRDTFSYCSEEDCYYCPDGAELHFYSQGRKKNRIEKRYRTPACDGCRRRSECTSNKTGRIISCWVNEKIFDEMRQRVEAHLEILRKRKSMAEHPFGTIKQAMGANHFLTHGMNNVKTEMSMHVLVYKSIKGSQYGQHGQAAGSSSVI